MAKFTANVKPASLSFSSQLVLNYCKGKLVSARYNMFTIRRFNNFALLLVNSCLYPNVLKLGKAYMTVSKGLVN